jgi:hypothetical protein
MSEQPTQFESTEAPPLSEAVGSWSGNGVHTDEAVSAATDGDATTTDDAVAADGVAEEAPAAEATAEEAAAAEATAEEAPAAAQSDSAAAADSATTPSDEGTAFLAELVRAMRTTADAERARVGENIDRRREDHMAAIYARRESEATQMRELADEELRAIDGWAEAERQHIQLEHERRAQALQQDLETSLAEHSSKIDREIERVEAAIATHRALVDAFFATLERETDPVAIAQHAARRPAFPTLETIADNAAAADTAEAPGVAVMDPQSVSSSVTDWTGWNAVPGTPETSEPPANVEHVVASSESSEPVTIAVAAGSDEPQSGGILQAMPVSRPMSWLRRDRDSGEGANKDR